MKKTQSRLLEVRAEEADLVGGYCRVQAKDSAGSDPWTRVMVAEVVGRG